MKLVFVAGMEHSGSTLTDYLLSSHPAAMGIGEAAGFFSPTQFAARMQRHGNRRFQCSCGQAWEDCPFWGPLLPLCGKNSSEPMWLKYRRMFEHARGLIGDDVVLVDSSKAAPILVDLVRHREDLGLGPDELRVMFTVKDVRSFTKSQSAKRDARPGMVAKARSFNLWLQANGSFMDMLEREGIDWRLNLYERLCADPDGFLASSFDWLGLPRPEAGSTRGGQSHIVMGNLGFAMDTRKREQVRYDSRWFQDDEVNLLYLLHWRARALNRRLYAIAGNQGARG
jgi:hypothetical protein